MKLLFTLLLGCFCIYGFERLGVVSVDDFEVVEPAVKSTDAGIGYEKFTDHIVAKRKESH